MPDGGNWADRAGYDRLAGIGAAGLAWEWLRRDPGYRRAWRASARRCVCSDTGSASAPGYWGLVRFEDPERDAIAARPVWTRSIDPHVLVAEAEATIATVDSFVLADWSRWVTCVACGCGSEHVLLCDGAWAVRLDIVRGSVFGGPVRLRYHLKGVASAAAPLLTLRRFLALIETDAFDPALFALPSRLDRRLLELRVHDALRDGVDHQTIARVLYGDLIAAARWRIESSSFRYRVQRLATAARAMAAGGWRRLFGGACQQ